MKILFMCVANSARSQIAEGLAKKILGETWEICSAGSAPSSLNPLAVEVLSEIGLDISGNWSKSIEDLDPKFFNSLDFVITLCAEEVCPIISSQAQKIHWPLPDPAVKNQISPEERLSRFRETREAISFKLVEFKREIEARN